MTLKEKRLHDIIDKILNACRQGECDLEELRLDDNDVSQLKGVCPVCHGGRIRNKMHCPRCKLKGIL